MLKVKCRDHSGYLLSLDSSYDTAFTLNEGMVGSYTIEIQTSRSEKVTISEVSSEEIEFIN